MTRIVLDTNIILSAVIFGGKPEQILRLVQSKKIVAITSTDILIELAGVLINKFSREKTEVIEVVSFISNNMEIIKPGQRLTVVSDDADKRVLECATSGSADVIISGDHHLLKLGAFQGISILAPADFLKDFNQA